MTTAAQKKAAAEAAAKAATEAAAAAGATPTQPVQGATTEVKTGTPGDPAAVVAGLPVAPEQTPPPAPADPVDTDSSKPPKQRVTLVIQAILEKEVTQTFEFVDFEEYTEWLSGGTDNSRRRAEYLKANRSFDPAEYAEGLEVEGWSLDEVRIAGVKE